MSNDILSIRRLIPFDVFDYTTLVSALPSYFKPRDKITKLLAGGNVVRIKKGLYCFGAVLRKRPLSLEYVANLIYGPSYVSLEYALAYHDMIPERVDIVTSVAIPRSRDFVTPIIEVDTDPPGGFVTETRYVLLPIPFSVRTFPRTGSLRREASRNPVSTMEVSRERTRLV